MKDGLVGAPDRPLQGHFWEAPRGSSKTRSSSHSGRGYLQVHHGAVAGLLPGTGASMLGGMDTPGYTGTSAQVDLTEAAQI